MKLTTIKNLFLDLDKDMNYHRNRIAAIQLDKSRIFKQEYHSKLGTLRGKAKIMGISASHLSDVLKGKRGITERLVDGLAKL
jgi:hypothetical protein